MCSADTASHGMYSVPPVSGCLLTSEHLSWSCYHLRKPMKHSTVISTLFHTAQQHILTWRCPLVLNIMCQIYRHILPLWIWYKYSIVVGGTHCYGFRHTASTAEIIKHLVRRIITNHEGIWGIRICQKIIIRTVKAKPKKPYKNQSWQDLSWELLYNMSDHYL